MNEYRYIVTYHQPGFVGASKIYKYRKSALTYAHKIKAMFAKDTEIMVEEMRKREDGKVIRTGRWDL